MRLTPLTPACNTAQCPQVFEQDEATTLVVQGQVLDSAPPGVDLGEGEGLVLVPREVIIEAARAILKAGPA